MRSRARCRSLPSRPSKRRSLLPRIDQLESRSLLTTTSLVVQPTFVIGALTAAGRPRGGIYTGTDSSSLWIQQHFFRRRRGRRQRRDDRHRRRLQRPEHPDRSEHVRHPVRSARHDGQRCQRNRRDNLSAQRFNGRLGARGGARRGVGACHGAGASIMLVEASSTMTTTCSRPSTTRRLMRMSCR